jgi:phosphoribosylaminoimidazolecarboxamide formyltransferase/IMP cyclohydrolase
VIGLNRECSGGIAPAKTKKTALISVYDKSGVLEFARDLSEMGFEIISSGGTARHLRDGGLNVRDVSDLTGFPEILFGRVKTLHPKIHGGILCRRDDPRHLAEVADHDIPLIDLVCVNLYPFRSVAGKGDASLDDVIENIDIGGPTLIRAAAKNYRDVIVTVNSESYGEIARGLKVQGDIDLDTRFRLACEAFEHTAVYDTQVSSYLSHLRSTSVKRGPDEFVCESEPAGGDSQASKAACKGDAKGKVESGAGDKESGKGSSYDFKEGFGDRLLLYLEKASDLRYGENPHQAAAYYRPWPEPVSEASKPVDGIAPTRKIQGKELSFNNINDANAAMAIVSEFTEPAACAVKHTNPCGVACGKDLAEAFRGAYESDPVSIFGGIVAFNKTVTEDVAARLSPIFLEVVLAPAFDEKALEILSKKKDLRILTFDPSWAKRRWRDIRDTENIGSQSRGYDSAGGIHTGRIRKVAPGYYLAKYDLKGVVGGLLVQERDLPDEEFTGQLDGLACLGGGQGLLPNDWRIVTKRAPEAREIADLVFGWLVCKHVKSNAIVIASSRRTCGIGAGQMSRIDAAKIAIGHAGPLAKGAVMASDAFFPFSDVVNEAYEAKITAIVQPGGSVRDAESIEACDAHGIAMIFTGKRHFKH